MRRSKDLYIIIMRFMLLSICWVMATKVIAFEGQTTHPAIMEKAVARSVLSGDYLRTQIGLNSDLNTPLELTGQFQGNINMRIAQEPKFEWSATKLSIKQWLKEGSKLEDVPNPRARHHFHDPIRNTGLNNSEANSRVRGALWLGSKWLYPDYWGFDATGLSTLERAKGLDGEWGNEYLNYYNWIYARDLFYFALTEQSESIRKAHLGSMFVTLGHICHLLQDVGVPAHTRNDFIFGHMVGDFYEDLSGRKKPWTQLGHPFEHWVESQIKNNDGNIPGEFLTRLMYTPPAFGRLSDYFDTDICESSGVAQWQGDNSGWPETGFGNPPPEKSWGLAECSNYQFLSYSTVFKNSGLQSFPHPAKEHTRVDWYASGPDGERQYYRIGYDVPHLGRVTYTTFYAWLIPIYTVETTTTEEERVYEDYAKRTIPRTIDYTTGLINYFFRGKLIIEQTDCNNGRIVITITNKSSNSGFAQILKGGTFTLYWDDSAGNRTQVSDFTVYRPGTEPQPGNEWNSSTLLYYDESTKAVLTPLTSQDVNYILVYEGIISSNPNSPDLDDTRQIATAIQKLQCLPLINITARIELKKMS
jgi:hypothetical protein